MKSRLIFGSIIKEVPVILVLKMLIRATPETVATLGIPLTPIKVLVTTPTLEIPIAQIPTAKILTELQTMQVQTRPTLIVLMLVVTMLTLGTRPSQHQTPKTLRIPKLLMELLMKVSQLFTKH